MKIFIVDDEPPAVSTIEALLEQHEGDFPLNVVGTSNDSVEAIEQINSLKPDVLFLDVEMPTYNGFELLEKLNYKELMVVFVTAYRDYAVEAFKTNALDYIVKPISPNAFNRCLDRIQEKLNLKQFNSEGIDQVIDQFNNRSIAIKAKEGYEVIDCNNIVHIKSEGAYSEFHLQNGKRFIQSKNLKQSLKLLPIHQFKRISRSAIINVEHVVSFSFNDGGTILLSNEEELLIGKTYRTEIFSYLKERYSL